MCSLAGSRSCALNVDIGIQVHGRSSTPGFFNKEAPGASSIFLVQIPRRKGLGFRVYGLGFRAATTNLKLSHLAEADTCRCGALGWYWQ